jgi:hypothetical protein
MYKNNKTFIFILSTVTMQCQTNLFSIGKPWPNTTLDLTLHSDSIQYIYNFFII